MKQKMLHIYCVLFSKNRKNSFSTTNFEKRIFKKLINVRTKNFPLLLNTRLESFNRLDTHGARKIITPNPPPKNPPIVFSTSKNA